MANLFHPRAFRRLCTFFLVAGVAPSLTVAAMTRVAGTVRDRDGKPVVDASVTLSAIEGGAMTVSQPVKKDGKYFFMARSGSYKLEVKAGGGLVLQSVKGRAEGPNHEEVWAVDQAVSASNPPTINVGNSQEIRLDIVVGRPAGAATQSSAPEVDASATLAKVKEGKCEEALPELEALSLREGAQASAHYLHAYCLQRLERHEEALAATDRVLAADPAFVGAQLVRGRSLKALGRNEEAIAALQKEIAGGNAAQVAEARASLATIYRDMGRTEEAIAAFEQLLQAEPDRREYLIELSQLQAKKGNRAEAEKLLARADAAGGGDPAAELNIAIGHLNDREYDKTRAIVERVLAKPDLSTQHRAIALSLLARCQLNAGEMQQGIASLEEALKLDPGSSLAAENREILAATKPK